MTPTAARRSAIAAATAAGTLYGLTEDERVRAFRIWAARRPGSSVSTGDGRPTAHALAAVSDVSVNRTLVDSASAKSSPSR